VKGSADDESNVASAIASYPLSLTRVLFDFKAALPLPLQRTRSGRGPWRRRSDDPLAEPADEGDKFAAQVPSTRRFPCPRTTAMAKAIPDAVVARWSRSSCSAGRFYWWPRRLGRVSRMGRRWPATI